VLTQTPPAQPSWSSLLGIRHVVLAVNKMDLVDFDRAVFDGIVADYHSFAEALGFDEIITVPISGRDGDNIAVTSARRRGMRGRR
jgi:bifunctional enzyme CysN/CysC